MPPISMSGMTSTNFWRSSAEHHPKHHPTHHSIPRSSPQSSIFLPNRTREPLSLKAKFVTKLILTSASNSPMQSSLTLVDSVRGSANKMSPPIGSVLQTAVPSVRME